MYKIKIVCTNKNDLSFGGKKINIKVFPSIISKLTNIDYIEIIQVVKKKHNSTFVSKTIEFFINRELDKIEYMLFIAKMKDAGFHSENDINIQLINADQNEIKFDYKFTSMGINKTIMFKKRKNNSNYTTQQFYKK